mgnify:CR=1 FL=1|tara:strand:+ start:100 stop:567 length:468 start_codon:yes stop_codon:yes gene_type:complete
MKITNENVTEELLSKVAFGDLKETFTDLGIESTWKPGVKATTLVSRAIKKLNDIKALKETLDTPEEIEKAISDQEAIDKDQLIKDAEAQAEDEALAKKAEDDAIKGDELKSKEDIEIMIVKLQRALVHAVSSHRIILVTKLSVFEKLLVDKEYIK